MKKIAILTFAFAGLLSFSACESDRDSNPTLQDPNVICGEYSCLCQLGL